MLCANRNFFRMKMAPLEEFKVPAEIEALEQNTDPAKNRVQMIQMKSAFRHNRSNENTYFDSYSTMIHLEEAAHSKSLARFNTKKIYFQHSENNIFCFENNVNTHHIHL